MKRYTRPKREKALYPVLQRYIERQKNKQNVEKAKREYLRKRIISLERKEQRHKTKISKLIKNIAKLSKTLKGFDTTLAYLRHCKNTGRKTIQFRWLRGGSWWAIIFHSRELSLSSDGSSLWEQFFQLVDRCAYYNSLESDSLHSDVSRLSEFMKFSKSSNYLWHLNITSYIEFIYTERSISFASSDSKFASSIIEILANKIPKFDSRLWHQHVLQDHGLNFAWDSASFICLFIIYSAQVQGIALLSVCRSLVKMTGSAKKNRNPFCLLTDHREHH